ncbi:MAG: hypothetical protein EOM23_10435 [Candidatus Moranbacteria bacterium]|nr:hypothetical protein [Candidatus Moranbacteria bacterium]
MVNIETISAKELNKIMKTNPALYRDLLQGKSIDIRNDAVKPLTTTGTKTVKPVFKVATWSDYTQNELIQMRRSNNSLFLMLLEAESNRIRKRK